MTDPENPPAFPFCELNGDGSFWAQHNGMTLRDWFAGQWLAGMLAGGQKFESPEMVAEEAFAVANAMLSARKVQP